MTVAIAIWSIAVQPGKKTKFVAQGDIRVTNATLGDKITDENSRTTVKFTYDTPQRIDDDDDVKVPPKTTTFLCALTPGKIEQAILDLVLEEDEEYEVEVVGKNTVHLSGNYIDQAPNVPFNPEDDSDMDSDEDEFDLRDVSSDVEVDPNELDIPSDEEDAARFEEVNDDADADASKTLKRAREDDVMDVEEGGQPKLSKKEKKKLNKKLKTEDGTAVAVPAADTTLAKVDGEAKPDEKKDKKKKDKKNKDGDAAPAVAGKNLKDLGEGLKIEDVKPGTGRACKKGDTVSMRYVGKLENGTIFDSNTKGKPFTFRLGAGEVIKGWDQGIVGMMSSGERLLIVPPKLAYGNRKSGPIPPGSTLRFEVKLLEIK